jgi:hypothetical protein
MLEHLRLKRPCAAALLVGLLCMPRPNCRAPASVGVTLYALWSCALHGFVRTVLGSMMACSLLLRCWFLVILPAEGVSVPLCPPSRLACVFPLLALWIFGSASHPCLHDVGTCRCRRCCRRSPRTTKVLLALQHAAHAIAAAAVHVSRCVALRSHVCCLRSVCRVRRSMSVAAQTVL